MAYAGTGAGADSFLVSRLTPTLRIDTPFDGQNLRVGDKTTLVWTIDGADKPKKSIVTLRRSNGKPIARKTIKAGKGFYTFKVKSKYLPRLGQITVCRPRTKTSHKACDSVRVAVIAADAIPAVAENFNDGDADGWTVLDDTTPSNWQVVDGVYRQLNALGTNTKAVHKSYNLGSLSYQNSSLDHRDYRFSVRATPLSATGQDIGVLFRFRDRENYYRLSLSAANGFTRLEKKVAGEYTALATTARGYARGVPLDIAITARGNLFHIQINGEKVFAFYDDALPTGGIGLFCRDNCAFDDVDLTFPSLSPSIAVGKPEAHGVSTSTTFEVSAVVLNKPVTGSASVSFSLGGNANACSAALETQPGLYEAQCTAFSGAQATALTASLRQGSVALDSATHEAIAFGTQYIVIGDSITWGLGDNYAADDGTGDDRTVSSGYTSVLSRLLNANGLPSASVVYNNGIPGTRTADALNDYIDADLARHPQAQYVLVLLGTNDVAAGLRSGEGCTTNCAGTFKGEMQALIDKIVAAGRIPVVARLLPRFGETAPYVNPRKELDNEVIAFKYNKIIAEELVNARVGPDFYGFFLSETVNRFNLFIDDYLHPNGLGYRVLAGLWYQSLTGKTNGLPFILNTLCSRPVGGVCASPATYKQNLLEKGNAYYADRNFRLADIPPELKDGVWIMTRDADKTATAANFLEFSFAGQATVYVAYDDGEAGIPQWLSSFVRTNRFVSTDNPAAPTMRLYRRDNAQGTVVLGGNRALGAGGSPENYSVIVVPAR